MPVGKSLSQPVPQQGYQPQQQFNNNFGPGQQQIQQQLQVPAAVTATVSQPSHPTSSQNPVSNVNNVTTTAISSSSSTSYNVINNTWTNTGPGQSQSLDESQSIVTKSKSDTTTGQQSQTVVSTNGNPQPPPPPPEDPLLKERNEISSKASKSLAFTRNIIKAIREDNSEQNSIEKVFFAEPVPNSPGGLARRVMRQEMNFRKHNISVVGNPNEGPVTGVDKSNSGTVQKQNPIVQQQIQVAQIQQQYQQQQVGPHILFHPSHNLDGLKTMLICLAIILRDSRIFDEEKMLRGISPETVIKSWTLIEAAKTLLVTTQQEYCNSTYNNTSNTNNNDIGFTLRPITNVELANKMSDIVEFDAANLTRTYKSGENIANYEGLGLESPKKSITRSIMSERLTAFNQNQEQLKLNLSNVNNNSESQYQPGPSMTNQESFQDHLQSVEPVSFIPVPKYQIPPLPKTPYYPGIESLHPDANSPIMREKMVIQRLLERQGIDVVKERESFLPVNQDQDATMGDDNSGTGNSNANSSSSIQGSGAGIMATRYTSMRRNLRGESLTGPGSNQGSSSNTSSRNQSKSSIMNQQNQASKSSNASSTNTATVAASLVLPVQQKTQNQQNSPRLSKSPRSPRDVAKSMSVREQKQSVPKLNLLSPRDRLKITPRGTTSLTDSGQYQQQRSHSSKGSSRIGSHSHSVHSGHSFVHSYHSSSANQLDHDEDHNDQFSDPLDKVDKVNMDNIHEVIGKMIEHGNSNYNGKDSVSNQNFEGANFQDSSVTFNDWTSKSMNLNNNQNQNQTAPGTRTGSQNLVQQQQRESSTQQSQTSILLDNDLFTEPVPITGPDEFHEDLHNIRLKRKLERIELELDVLIDPLLQKESMQNLSKEQYLEANTSLKGQTSTVAVTVANQIQNQIQNTNKLQQNLNPHYHSKISENLSKFCYGVRDYRRLKLRQKYLDDEILKRQEQKLRVLRAKKREKLDKEKKERELRSDTNLKDTDGKDIKSESASKVYDKESDKDKEKAQQTERDRLLKAAGLKESSGDASKEKNANTTSSYTGILLPDPNNPNSSNMMIKDHDIDTVPDLSISERNRMSYQSHLEERRKNPGLVVNERNRNLIARSKRLKEKFLDNEKHKANLMKSKNLFNSINVINNNSSELSKSKVLIESDEEIKRQREELLERLNKDRKTKESQIRVMGNTNHNFNFMQKV